MDQNSVQDEVDTFDDGREPLLDTPGNMSNYDNIEGKPTCTKARILVILLIIIILILTILLIVIGVHCKSDSKDGKASAHHIAHNGGIFFFHISDTHLDLFYDQNTPANTKNKWTFCRKFNNSQEKASNVGMFGRFGCDTPQLLLQSAVDHMKTIYEEREKAAEFVLITGDQSAHDYNKFVSNYNQMVAWSIGNNTKVMSDTLDIPIFPALGNNDVPLDYMAPTEGLKKNWYKMLASIFEPAIFHEKVEKLNSKDEFRETFEFGGYYKIILQGGELVLIILNTNYWSRTAYGLDASITGMGDTQMLWLEDQLSNASSSGQKVIIAGHIPPGCSTYSGDSDNPHTWLKNYTDIFVKKTADTYAHIVTVQLYGHTHQDKIKLQDLNDDFPSKASSKQAIALLGPSITPIFRSNPAYRLVEYDKNSKELIDYTQYYVDLPAANAFGKTVWQKEYSFNETYGKSITVNGLNALVDELIKVTLPTSLAYNLHMKTKASLDDTRRFIEYCGAKHYKEEMYNQCIAFYKNIGV